MAREEIVILNGARTPMTEWVGGRAGNGKPGGALKDVSAIDLGEGALEETVMVALRESYCGCYMAQASDKLARRYNVSREEQDAYAFRSLTEGRRELDSCLRSEEIVAVTPPGREARPVEK